MEQNFVDKYPELARKWDYDRNHTQEMETILEPSCITVRWQCQPGHQHETSTHERANVVGCSHDPGKTLPYKESADEAAT